MKIERDMAKQHHLSHETKQDPKEGEVERWVGDEAVKTC